MKEKSIRETLLEQWSPNPSGAEAGKADLLKRLSDGGAKAKIRREPLWLSLCMFASAVAVLFLVLVLPKMYRPAIDEGFGAKRDKDALGEVSAEDIKEHGGDAWALLQGTTDDGIIADRAYRQAVLALKKTKEKFSEFKDCHAGAGAENSIKLTLTEGGLEEERNILFNALMNDCFPKDEVLTSKFSSFAPGGMDRDENGNLKPMKGGSSHVCTNTKKNLDLKSVCNKINILGFSKPLSRLETVFGCSAEPVKKADVASIPTLHGFLLNDKWHFAFALKGERGEVEKGELTGWLWEYHFASYDVKSGKIEKKGPEKYLSTMPNRPDFALYEDPAHFPFWALPEHAGFHYGSDEEKWVIWVAKQVEVLKTDCDWWKRLWALKALRQNEILLFGMGFVDCRWQLSEAGGKIFELGRSNADFLVGAYLDALTDRNPLICREGMLAFTKFLAGYTNVDFGTGPQARGEWRKWILNLPEHLKSKQYDGLIEKIKDIEAGALSAHIVARPEDLAWEKQKLGEEEKKALLPEAWYLLQGSSENGLLDEKLLEELMLALKHVKKEFPERENARANPGWEMDKVWIQRQPGYAGVQDAFNALGKLFREEFSEKGKMGDVAWGGREFTPAQGHLDLIWIASEIQRLDSGISKSALPVYSKAGPRWNKNSVSQNIHAFYQDGKWHLVLSRSSDHGRTLFSYGILAKGEKMQWVKRDIEIVLSKEGRAIPTKYETLTWGLPVLGENGSTLEFATELCKHMLESNDVSVLAGALQSLRQGIHVKVAFGFHGIKAKMDEKGAKIVETYAKNRDAMLDRVNLLLEHPDFRLRREAMLTLQHFFLANVLEKDLDFGTAKNSVSRWLDWMTSIDGKEKEWFGKLKELREKMK